MSFTPPGEQPPPSMPPPTPPTPGWWLASDGNWYPPEAAPGVTPAAPSYGPPPVTYGPSNTPYGYTPYQQTRGTNGFAIASMVLGILWLYWIGSILALIFGYVAKGQIDKSQGAQGGRGMAIAGIVLGWVGVGVLVIVLIAAVAQS